MSQRFGAAMGKMALIGQNVQALHDCSEVIPAPTLPTPAAVTLPLGKTVLDLELLSVCCFSTVLPLIPSSDFPLIIFFPVPVLSVVHLV